MTINATPLASASSNAKQNSNVDALAEQGALAFYRPQTNEMVFVSADSATAFENECRRMDSLVFELRQAKEEQLRATDFLLGLQADLLHPAKKFDHKHTEMAQAEKRLQEAAAVLEAAQKKLEAEIKPLGELDSTGDKLMELIPVWGRRVGVQNKKVGPLDSDDNAHAWTRKWTYVRSEKVASHMRSYKLNAGEKQAVTGAPSSSVLNNGKIDVPKLMGQLKTFEAAGKLAEWQGAKGTLAGKLNLSIQNCLQDWASSMNQGNTNLELTPEVQVLRYFAGAGLQGEWKPKEGKVALRANARGEFMVAEGKIKAAMCLPDVLGMEWSYVGPKSGTLYKVGLIRTTGEVELSALVGASIVGELDATIEYTDMMKGRVGMKGSRRSDSKAQFMKERAVDVGKKARDGAAVTLQGDAFAGAKAGGSIKLTLQWNSPESKGFENLATVGPLLMGQAGAGIGGQLSITFVGGKFRFIAMASACLGPGLRGKLELEVDFMKAFEMCKFLSHALNAVGFERLEILGKAAFEAWRDLSMLAIQTGEELVAIAKRAQDAFDEEIDALIRTYERESARVQLMNRVLSKPRMLDFAPPETKGMILYQLTRHSWMTKTVFAGENQGINLDTLKRRKDAVFVVCKKARNKAEFRNIMQHMSERGTKLPGAWEAQFAHVKRFMDMGIDTADMDRQVQERYDQLSASVLDSAYQRLYDEPVVGYAFVDNDLPQYAFNGQAGSHMGHLAYGGFDPSNASQVIA